MDEEVDIAIVGGSLCGLACGVALHRVAPGAALRVFEQRRRPAEGAVPSSGGVRLEPNALRALEAISQRLAARVAEESLACQRVVIHDTEAGTVITRQAPPPSAGTCAPQPAPVVGWLELQSILLNQLPHGTVHWGATAVGYEDGAGGAVLQLRVEHQDAQQQQQQQGQLQEAPRAGGPAGRRQASPFEGPAQAAADAAGSGGEAERTKDSGAGAAVASKPTSRSADDGGGGGRSPSNSRDSGAGGRDSSGASGGRGGDRAGAAGRAELRTVRARLVVAADGPTSLLRRACLGAEGPPESAGVVQLLARLPGDLLSTIPVDDEAWWLAPGMAFHSHPLRCGDVAWEAHVSNSCLERLAGARWDARQGGPVPGLGGAEAGGAPRAASGAAAAAPAGDLDSGLAQGEPAARLLGQDVWALLPQLLAAGSFPKAVRDMVQSTLPEAVVATPELTRPAGQLPASPGRGSLALVGQAVCSMRPTGQEVAQALEDAAVLGACVMEAGLSREALRRLELARWPRWRHAMQASQDLASCSSLCRPSLQQALLDYQAQLHAASFAPLRPPRRRGRHPGWARQLLRWGGFTMLAWGAAGALGALPQQQPAGGGSRSAAPGPIGGMLAGVEGAVGGAGKLLSGAAPAPLASAAARLAEPADKGLQAAAEAAGGVAGGGEVVHGAVPSGRQPGTAARLRDAAVGGVLAAGGVIGRPFARLLQHRVTSEAARKLGAF